MPFPPDPLATDKDASTPVDPTDHPDHHNALAAAINDTVDELVAYETANDAAVAGKADASEPIAAAHISDTSAAHAASAISYAGGSGMSATDVEAAIDELATEKLSALSPWTTDIDAASFDLANLDQLGLGGAVDNAATLKFSRALTGLTTEVLYGIYEADTFTYSSASSFATVVGLQIAPTITVSSGTMFTVGGVVGAPTVAGAATTVYGFRGGITQQSGTTVTGVSFDAISSGGGNITDMIGLRITGLSRGTTKWGMQVGAYQSYHEGPFRHGAVSGGSTATPLARLEVVEPTIGSDVVRWSSVATNDDPVERVVQGRAVTTDGNIATQSAITCAVDTTTMIFSYVVARRTGGSSGAAQDGAGYTLVGTFKNTAGTVAQIGATVATVVNESQAAWACVYDVTGATARIRVTGAANNDVTWHSTSHIFQVSS